jgi:hypothetical protein
VLLLERREQLGVLTLLPAKVALGAARTGPHEGASQPSTVQPKNRLTITTPNMPSALVRTQPTSVGRK